ncbi:MAG: hypothetical protein GY753_09335 [Gammaproteobacteria bacterium]|nr:hypothetical protein [Gammaproteobacteria bacterium]
MKIYYTKAGLITSACDDNETVEGQFLQLDAAKIKKDFLDTFALGKYRVEKGKLVAVKGFRKPRMTKDLFDIPLK